jgi:hypothetical protein
MQTSGAVRGEIAKLYLPSLLKGPQCPYRRKLLISETLPSR